MLSFLAVVAGLGWSLFLIQRYRNSDALRFPELSTPISSEEQKALDDLSILRSKLDDALTRLKHAEQERNRAVRDEKQMRLRGWRWERKERELRRVLDRDDGGDVPEPVAAAVELVGTCERAG